MFSPLLSTSHCQSRLSEMSTYVHQTMDNACVYQIKTEVEEEVLFSNPPEMKPLCSEDQTCSDLPTLKTEPLSAEQGEFYEEIDVKEEPLGTLEEEQEAGQFVLENEEVKQDMEDNVIDSSEKAIQDLDFFIKQQITAQRLNESEEMNQVTVLANISETKNVCITVPHVVEPGVTLEIKKSRFKKLSYDKFNNMRLRRKGKAYVGRKKTLDGIIKVPKPAASIHARCTGCTSKLLHCNNMTEKDRKKSHDFYWSLSNNKKMIFVKDSVNIRASSRRKVKQDPCKRMQERIFFLWKNDEKLRVCGKMFASTLGISLRTIRRWTDPKTPKAKYNVAS